MNNQTPLPDNDLDFYWIILEELNQSGRRLQHALVFATSPEDARAQVLYSKSDAKAWLCLSSMKVETFVEYMEAFTREAMSRLEPKGDLFFVLVGDLTTGARYSASLPAKTKEAACNEILCQMRMTLRAFEETDKDRFDVTVVYSSEELARVFDELLSKCEADWLSRN